MAIYTNYGRFLKAKYFKENLENHNETYMVLGMGDPDWDSNRLSLPIAPYNSSITDRSNLLPIFIDSAEENQFFDNRLAMYFLAKIWTIGFGIYGSVLIINWLSIMTTNNCFSNTIYAKIQIFAIY